MTKHRSAGRRPIYFFNALRVFFIAPFIFILKLLRLVFTRPGRKLVLKKWEKAARAFKDPWTYERFFLLKPRELVTFLLAVLLFAAFFAPKDIFKFPVRAIIADRLKAKLGDVAYKGDGWYQVVKEGVRITGVDRREEPIVIYVNPTNWAFSNGPAAIIERKKKLGSDDLDYGTESVPVWVQGDKFWIKKDNKNIYGTINKDEKLFYSFDVGTDSARDKKIKGEIVETIDGKVVIEDIYSGE